MKRPDLADKRNDDISYRYDLHRISPHHYLNTLKGYKLMPAASNYPLPELPKGDIFVRNRRLSRTKYNMGKHSFSTFNRLPSKMEAEQ